MSYFLRPPVSGLDSLSQESRIVATPWSRIVRGVGLGQHPIGYDSGTRKLICRSVTLLRDKLAGADTYTTFTAALISLILAAVRPGNCDLRLHIVATTEAFSGIANPYSRTMAGTIMLDAIAKLHLEIRAAVKVV